MGVKYFQAKYTTCGAAECTEQMISDFYFPMPVCDEQLTRFNKKFMLSFALNFHEREQWQRDDWREAQEFDAVEYRTQGKP